jgi:hypothetical protein
VIVVATTLVVGVWRSGLSHSLRDQLLSLTPKRGVDLALSVGIGVAVLSIAFAGLRRLAPSAYGRIAGATQSLRIPRPTPLVALTAIVSAAAGIRILRARFETEPRVFGDEIIYTDLAKNIARHGLPFLRRFSTASSRSATASSIRSSSVPPTASRLTERLHSLQ